MSDDVNGDEVQESFEDRLEEATVSLRNDLDEAHELLGVALDDVNALDKSISKLTKEYIAAIKSVKP